jgi:hypothetical protein
MSDVEGMKKAGFHRGNDAIEQADGWCRMGKYHSYFPVRDYETSNPGKEEVHPLVKSIASE